MGGGGRDYGLGKKEAYHLKGNLGCVVVMTNVAWPRKSSGKMVWCVSFEEKEREEEVFYDR